MLMSSRMLMSCVVWSLERRKADCLSRPARVSMVRRGWRGHEVKSRQHHSLARLNDQTSQLISILDDDRI